MFESNKRDKIIGIRTIRSDDGRASFNNIIIVIYLKLIQYAIRNTAFIIRIVNNDN